MKYTYEILIQDIIIKSEVQLYTAYTSYTLLQKSIVQSETLAYQRRKMAHTGKPLVRDKRPVETQD